MRHAYPLKGEASSKAFSRAATLAERQFINKFEKGKAGEVGFRTSRDECFKKRAVAC